MVMLASRNVNFVMNLISSPKYSMRVLARCTSDDLQTVMGRNLFQISKECYSSSSCLSSGLVLSTMKYFGVAENEVWRIGILNELLKEETDIPGFLPCEIEDIKTYLCTS